jgi:SulP family sulfate permease
VEKFKPELFTVLKSYSKDQLQKDVTAGIIVAIIALPLSIALGLASGVTPSMGIYTAIIAGFLVAVLGGSKVQIAGPTAAFATIVAGIVLKNGVEGLMLATLMAGVLLIIMGLLQFGNLLKYIPYTITTGFTAGIAITLLIGQLKDFTGIAFPQGVAPISTLAKLTALTTYGASLNVQAVLVGLVSLAILIFWPKINAKIPGSLIAVIGAAAMVKFMGLQVNTIGSLFTISNELPHFTFNLQAINLASIHALFPDALTIAVLAGIESLLSAVVADSMIQSKHRSNTELIAQGLANIGSACFGGIPATGAIARTAANIKNGGRSPISGMVHSLVLLLVLVVFIPYAALIPMPTIAAILFQVAYNMSGWRNVVHLCETAPKSDLAVLLLTLGLTVVFDLVIAIEVGVLLAAALFLRRMSEVATVHGWTYIDNENDADNIELRQVPKDTLVYEMVGPLFFAAADNILRVTVHEKYNYLILRMRSVSAIDATAMHNFEILVGKCKKAKIQLVFSHVNEQPMKVMEKAGFVEAIGPENFCAHIDDALKIAEAGSYIAC